MYFELGFVKNASNLDGIYHKIVPTYYSWIADSFSKIAPLVYKISYTRIYAVE